jgi:hypothetical protein
MRLDDMIRRGGGGGTLLINPLSLTPPSSPLLSLSLTLLPLYKSMYLLRLDLILKYLDHCREG